MREILFRGKRLDDGAWVEGYYLSDCARHAIAVGHILVQGWELHEVDPATVGQFTGLTDKNGRKIFEGDVVEFDAYQRHYIGVVTTQDGNTDIRCKDASPFLDDAVKKRSAVVIGTIHDNPELLGGAE